MSPELLPVIYGLAGVGLLAVIGLLIAVGLYAKLGGVNARLKALDDQLDRIQDQTDSKKEEKINALAKQLRHAFPEIADGVDNRGFGLSVYNAHKAYRKAINYFGSPGSSSWSKKANAELSVLADTVNDFDGHSVITRIPNGEWKKRLAVFIKTGA